MQFSRAHHAEHIHSPHHRHHAPTTSAQHTNKRHGRRQQQQQRGAGRIPVQHFRHDAPRKSRVQHLPRREKRSGFFVPRGTHVLPWVHNTCKKLCKLQVSDVQRKHPRRCLVHKESHGETDHRATHHQVRVRHASILSGGGAFNGIAQANKSSLVVERNTADGVLHVDGTARQARRAY